MPTKRNRRCPALLTSPMFRYTGTIPGRSRFRGLISVTPEEAKRRNEEQVSERIDALRLHLKLAPDSTEREVLVRLAADHFKGFSYLDGREPRKDSRSFSSAVKLVRSVEALLGKHPKMTLNGAFLCLAEEMLPERASKEERRSKAGTLSRWYYQFVKSYPRYKVTRR
jgi:hypothetical protein